MEGFEVLPTIFSIVVVLLGLGATLLILRWATNGRSSKSGRGRNGQLIEVVERQSVGRNSSLVVVRYNGTEHVLGVTEASITQLTEGTIDLRGFDADDESKRDKANRTKVIEALRDKTVRR